MSSENDFSDELLDRVSFKADPGQEALRIDMFLLNRIEGKSRNKIQLAAKAGNVLVGGKSVKPNYKVRPGDEVEVIFPKVIGYDLFPEDIPIDVVFEDEHLLVVDKPPGLVVHPGVGNKTGTLLNAVLHHVKELRNSERERPGLVHRLDKDTSGLLVIAKTDEALTTLAHQFFERTVNRKYLSLVWGNVELEEGRVEANIGRDVRYRKLMTCFPEGDIGKYAATNYKVVERFGYTTLIECKLETGRTHQIRVHMKHIGHTVFNDERYGGDQILKGTVFTKYKQFVMNCFKLMPTQALHAHTLGFMHPATGEELFFTSPLPENFQNVIKKWRDYSNYKKNTDEDA